MSVSRLKNGTWAAKGRIRHLRLDVYLGAHPTLEDARQAVDAWYLRKYGTPPAPHGGINLTDWTSVQAYHDLGHTRAECETKFGLGRCAWLRAIRRGDLTVDERIRQ
jgi:hypothetical protein